MDAMTLISLSRSVNAVKDCNTYIDQLYPEKTSAKSFEGQRSEVRAKNVSLLAVRESDPCFKITYCSCLSSAQRFRSMRAFYTMMAPTSPLQQDMVS